jgi:hypothetical protein
MASTSLLQEGRGNTLSRLNVVIEVLNLAKEISSITPAKAVFGSVSALLVMIRVRFLVLPWISGSHLSRILWQMNKITLISGCHALMYAKLSTEG